MVIVLFSVTTTFALAALALPENFEHYMNLIKAFEIPAMIIFSGKTILAWPLCYHAFNGIRHLVGVCWLYVDTFAGFFFFFLYYLKLYSDSQINHEGLAAFFCLPVENGILIHWLIWYSLLIGWQAWDLGYGFDMGVLYKTGWLVFFGSMGAAAALAYFLWIKYRDFSSLQE